MCVPKTRCNSLTPFPGRIFSAATTQQPLPSSPYPHSPLLNSTFKSTPENDAYCRMQYGCATFLVMASTPQHSHTPTQEAHLKRRVLSDAVRVCDVLGDGLLAEDVLRALHHRALAHALERVYATRRVLGHDRHAGEGTTTQHTALRQHLGWKGGEVIGQFLFRCRGKRAKWEKAPPPSTPTSVSTRVAGKGRRRWGRV